MRQLVLPPIKDPDPSYPISDNVLVVIEGASGRNSLAPHIWIDADGGSGAARYTYATAIVHGATTATSTSDLSWDVAVDESLDIENVSVSIRSCNRCTELDFGADRLVILELEFAD